jgi:hypothetical protein
MGGEPSHSGTIVTVLITSSCVSIGVQCPDSPLGIGDPCAHSLWQPALMLQVLLVVSVAVARSILVDTFIVAST